MKTLNDFSPYNGGPQPFQDPNDSFSGASKGFRHYQTMNKGLIPIQRNDQSFPK